MKIYTYISNSHLSIAKHFGGCTIDDQKFIYIPKEDALIHHTLVKKYTKYKGTFEEFILSINNQ
jgi:hypothetical protein